MLINKVSDDTQWNGHDVVISIGEIFFIERFVCCMMKKSWAFSNLVAAISASLQETFVRSKYAIYKDFGRVGGNWNNNFQKSQMPGGLPGGGHVEASIWPIHNYDNCCPFLLLLMFLDCHFNIPPNFERSATGK